MSFRSPAWDQGNIGLAVAVPIAGEQVVVPPRAWRKAGVDHRPLGVGGVHDRACLRRDSTPDAWRPCRLAPTQSAHPKSGCPRVISWGSLSVPPGHAFSLDAHDSANAARGSFGASPCRQAPEDRLLHHFGSFSCCPDGSLPTKTALLRHTQLS